MLLSRSAAYLSLPRDITRTQAARSLLSAFLRDIGLPPPYQGRGTLPEHRDGIRQGVDANMVGFEGFDEAFCNAFCLGLWTGVKQATRFSTAAKSRVSLAA